MAKQLQLRKGTATEHDTFTGANGEVTVDTTNKTLRVHDGSTVGGTRLATFIEDVTSQVSASTETTAGKAKIATTEIAKAGVNNTDIITAKKLREALNAGGSAPISACRAWVLFNGVANTILASSGVLSVTRTATGLNTITLIDAVGSTAYGIFGNCRAGVSFPEVQHTVDTTNTGLKTSNSFQIRTMVSGYSNTMVDSSDVFVGVMY